MLVSVFLFIVLPIGAGPRPPPPPPYGVDFGCLGGLFQAGGVSTGAPPRPPPVDTRIVVSRNCALCFRGAPRENKKGAPGRRVR